jgi:hypothetical protein
MKPHLPNLQKNIIDKSNVISVGKIPGNVPGAFYDLYGLGWVNGVIAAGSARVDMRAGNATARIKMK